MLISFNTGGGLFIYILKDGMKIDFFSVSILNIPEVDP